MKPESLARVREFFEREYDAEDLKNTLDEILCSYAMYMLTDLDTCLTPKPQDHFFVLKELRDLMKEIE